MLTSSSTTRQLALSGIDTVLIPFGSTEQCGPYLPMHIDSLLVEMYARHYAAILDAYQIPIIPFNTSEEHSHFKGTVALSPQLLMALTKEIVDGLIRQGFKKFVIVSGHGRRVSWGMTHSMTCASASTRDHPHSNLS
jgi:creatinine amidohydrolase